MSGFQIWFIGAVIFFLLSFLTVYNHRKENTDEENAVKLCFGFLLSFFSWAGILLIACLELLARNKEK